MALEQTAELGKREYEKAKALLTGYLNERMRVTISDGRVIDGRLICTDRDCNLVLSNCEEFLSQEEMSKDKKKTPCMCMITIKIKNNDIISSISPSRGPF